MPADRQKNRPTDRYTKPSCDALQWITIVDDNDIAEHDSL